MRNPSCMLRSGRPSLARVRHIRSSPHFLEELESRCLLSVSSLTDTGSSLIVPSVVPLASSPALSGGLTPAEVQKAYGFDALGSLFTGGYNSKEGAGAGTTIAIVDAYDDPNIL